MPRSVMDWRGFAAQKILEVLQKMRFAHFLQHLQNQGERRRREGRRYIHG